MLGLALKTSAPRERYSHADEEGMSFGGVPAVSRSDQARDHHHARRSRPARHRYQDGHRRQPLCRDACRSESGPGHRAALTGERSRISTTKRYGICPPLADVCRGRSAAEGADRARAAARRATWSATRATASTTRLRCTMRMWGSPSTRRWTWRESPDIILLRRDLTAAPGRRGWTAHVRKHAEIYFHHHQRQFRQHGEHGAGHPVPAVPAVVRQTDST